MASLGIIEAALPQLTEDDRARYGGWYAAKSRELLDSGYLEPPAGTAPTISHLEAVQTSLYLLLQGISSGQGRKALELWQKMRSAVDAIAVRGKGGLQADQRSPVSRWIEEEMKARAVLAYLSADATFTYQAHLEHTAVDYSAMRFRMPCFERFFDDDDTERGWRGALHAQALSGPTGDEGVLLDGLLDMPPEERRDVIRRIVEDVFNGRSGFCALYGPVLALRLERIRLRQLALTAEIDIYSLAAKVPLEREPGVEYDFSPAEAHYLNRAQIVEDVVKEFNSAIPADLGHSLSHGNATLLFTRSTDLFGDAKDAHGVLIAIGSLHMARMQCWVADDVGKTAEFGVPAGHPYFASRPFISVLESGVTLVRLLQSHLAADPALRGAHFGGLEGVTDAGSIALAARKVDRGRGGDGFEWDVGVVKRYLQTLGKRYRPYGESEIGNRLFGLY
jgi:hypothetical protein